MVESFFTPRRWEKPFYETFGVKVAKEIIPTGGRATRRLLHLKKMNPNNSIDLKQLILRTKALEITHYIAAASLVLGIPLFFPHGFNIINALAYGDFQIFFNGYPIILQRYNRGLALDRLKKLQS